MANPKSVKPIPVPILNRGKNRWLINQIRVNRKSAQDQMLNMLSDQNEWLRRLIPEYKHLMRVNTKAKLLRETLTAAYAITEELFAEAEATGLDLNNIYLRGAMERLLFSKNDSRFF